MTIPIRADLTVAESVQQFALVSATNTEAVNIEPSEQIIVNVYGIDDYEGDYTVIPEVDAQIVPCENKRMVSDLTVTAIPYYEVSNTSGTTVYIADRLEF